jgi:hypothetical protein
MFHRDTPYPYHTKPTAARTEVERRGVPGADELRVSQ